jgi:hypothetical protein
MVGELDAPAESAFAALWPQWPIASSYAVSYLFIAIIPVKIGRVDSAMDGATPGVGLEQRRGCTPDTVAFDPARNLAIRGTTCRRVHMKT